MFSLDRVVPWGRSFDEYRRMFALRRLGPDDGACSGAPTVPPASTRRRPGGASMSSRAIRSTDARRAKFAIASRPRRRPCWNRREGTRTNSSGTTSDRWRSSAACGMRPWTPSFTTTSPDAQRGATWPRRCRRCHSSARRSVWRCARIFCSSTPARRRWSSMSHRLRNCAAWPTKCGSFRCWRSAVSSLPMSRWSRRI